MIKRKIDIDEISRSRVKQLVKTYNTLDHAFNLRSILKGAFENVDFSNYSKLMLHRFFNDSLINYYNGELLLKYQLFKRVAGKNLIAGFETRVENSRVDFITVNGVSTSFEIKSELDNLDKLSKQSLSYLKVFDYNYLVIDPKHKKGALEILPPSFGVLIFSKGRRVFERPAVQNRLLDPASQLNMLTKRELKLAFNNLFVAAEIRNRVSDERINYKFKQALKARYKARWEFLVSNKHEILPIDLQFFFNRNIEPSLIYNNG